MLSVFGGSGFLPLFRRRDGIISSPTEGIAAEQPENGIDKPFHNTMDLNSFHRISRTRRGETATGRHPGGDHFLVDPDGEQKRAFQREVETDFGEVSRRRDL